METYALVGTMRFRVNVFHSVLWSRCFFKHNYSIRLSPTSSRAERTTRDREDFDAAIWPDFPEDHGWIRLSSNHSSPAACVSDTIIVLKSGSINNRPLIWLHRRGLPRCSDHTVCWYHGGQNQTHWHVYVWLFCGHYGEEVDLSGESGFNLWYAALTLAAAAEID